MHFRLFQAKKKICQFLSFLNFFVDPVSEMFAKIDQVIF